MYNDEKVSPEYLSCRYSNTKPKLRKKFLGEPKHVINYFFYVAEEIRVIMSKMGIKKFNDLIGKTDRLSFDKTLTSWKTKGLDF